MSRGTLALLALLALAALAGVWVFNRLIALRNRAENAWSDIDVQLKRRWDLIPNLVNAVRGYAAHERQTFEKTTEARTRAQQAGASPQRAVAENELSHQTAHLLALAEAYPDLKADDLFRSLSRSLIEVENDIQSARRYYNAVVRDYNTAIRQFPTVMLAGPLGFRAREFFELDSATEAAAPRVDLKEPA